MGYTTKRDTEVVALGTSGISDVNGAYAQNHRRLASYYQEVDEGRLPIERGYLLDRDDRLRRYVITELMCNGVVDLAATASLFEVPDPEVFAAEIESLSGPGGLVEEGMVTIEDSTVRTTELGRLFVRRLASVFDVHTARRSDNSPVFSKTI